MRCRGAAAGLPGCRYPASASFPWKHMWDADCTFGVSQGSVAPVQVHVLSSRALESTPFDGVNVERLQGVT